MKPFYYFVINNGLYKIMYDLVNVFGVLYIYQLFDNNIYIAIGLLSAIYFTHSILEYPVALIVQKIGTRKSIIIGSILAIFSAVPMYFFSTKSLIVFALWILFTAVSKIFYYIPYHYYGITLTEGKSRGAGISYVYAMLLFAGLISPLIGGFATQTWGSIGLSVITVIIMLISILPILGLPDYNFNISRNPFSLLKDVEIRKMLKILFLNELQAKEKYWEIFIFVFVGSSYSEFGIIISAVTLITIPIIIIAGKFSDHHNRKNLLKLDSIVTGLIWVGRILVRSVFHVVAVDIASKINVSIKNETANTIAYDLAEKDNQQMCLDEKIVVREAAANLFVVINLLSGLLAFYFFGFNGVFIFAGIASLGLLFI